MNSNTTDLALQYLYKTMNTYDKGDMETYATYMRFTPGEFAQTYLQITQTLLRQWDNHHKDSETPHAKTTNASSSRSL